MSTSEQAVAEAGPRPHSWSERSLFLGPGLLRLPDGSYRQPQKAAFRLRCTGPLAHWEVDLSFDWAALPSGEERLLFLYPLPAQAAITSLVVTQQGRELGPQPTVRSLDDLPDGVTAVQPSPSFLETFGGEQRPILSLGLELYLKEWREGSPVELRLVFANGLPTVDGRLCLRVPGFVQESLRSGGEETDLSVRIELEDGDELVDEPTCSEPLASTQEGDVRVLEGSLGALNRDLEVSFRPGRTEMPVTRLRRGPENFLFSIFPPTSIPASPQRRDLVFAVDASENVLSGLFEMIRDDLCQTLRKLDDNDRFALVTYGRDIDGYVGGEFCEVSQVEEACRWLHTVEPKGRADIQPLLARIQSLPSQPDRQLCIFLLAAGHVGNEPAILKSLDFDQSDRRYYAVGIGSSVEQAFLRRLALLARGRCEVAPHGRCAEALARLLGQTRALLAEVTFEPFDGLDAELDLESFVPSRMSSLTPEGPVHCLGRGSPSSLRFRSKDETGVFFAGTVNARSTENPALRGVWAGMRVRELVDSVRLSTGARRKQLRAETSTLAQEYGILAEDTVFVLETEGGLDVQLSALPYRWKKSEETVVKVEEESAPAFDWRKGLKARDGLFKGARPGESAESGEVRHGLRRPGDGGSGKVSKAGRDGKPMLDRYGMSSPAANVLEDDFETEQASIEESAPQVTEETPMEASEGQALEAASEVSEPPSEEGLEGDLEPSTESSSPEPPALDSAEGSPAAPPEESAAPELAPLEEEPSAASELATESSESTEEASGETPPPSQAVPLEETEAIADQVALRTDSEVAPVSSPSPAEPSPASTPAGAVETVAAPSPVHPAASGLGALPQAEPVFSYLSDPMAEAKVRMNSYLEQTGEVEMRMALASLAALPSEVAKSGPDLPRILAQTVGHLEKRGYYSAAVSVLGLLLRDYNSPEVFKKMESLLIGWAQSLPPHQLPESVHILQTGLRICPGSDALRNGLEGLWQSWQEHAQRQGALPEVVQWRDAIAGEPPSDPLLPTAALELARLQQQQRALSQELAALRITLDERLGALPALLDEALEKRPAQVVVAAAPEATPPVSEPSLSSPPVAGSAPATVAPPQRPVETPPVEAPSLEEPLVEAPSVEAPPAGLDTFQLDLTLEIPLPQEASPASEDSELSVELPLPGEQVAPQETLAAPDAPAAVSPAAEEEIAAGREPESSHPEEVASSGGSAPEDEESGESLNLTRDELLELLQAEPRDESGHRSVKTLLADGKDRINFYRDLARLDAAQPYHSLSLARAYREADQTKVAVVHYQKYLRSEKDAPAYLELAEAYEELGKANLAVSARKAAELMG